MINASFLIILQAENFYFYSFTHIYIYKVWWISSLNAEEDSWSEVCHAFSTHGHRFSFRCYNEADCFENIHSFVFFLVKLLWKLYMYKFIYNRIIRNITQRTQFFFDTSFITCLPWMSSRSYVWKILFSQFFL